jgi:hypothetical protein
VVVAVLTVAIAGGACGGEKVSDARDLRTALGKTERQSRSFVYAEATADRRLAVEGIVEDDYRYKARVSIDGTPVVDEVGLDDALAVRFSEPSALDLFVASDKPAPTTTTDLLRARHWVLDPGGAPELVAATAQRRRVGEDPVLDSITVLAYIEDVMSQSLRVSKFNAQALDYIAREDRFPKPNRRSGVVRYDIKPRRIVRASQGSAATGLPDITNFRRMSVYVKDGIVIQVLEDVDVLTRLDRLVTALDLKVPASLAPSERARRAMTALNEQRAAQGVDPIRVRTMSLELLDVGKRQAVALPTDTTEASLSLLRNRGAATPLVATTPQ